MDQQISFFESRVKKNVLLSLLEKPFNEILDGKKVFEFRKQYTREKSKAFVYISKTKKQICAIIDFDVPIYDTSHNIALLSERMKPGSYNNIITYFTESYGFAIPINSISLINPISLNELKKKFANFIVPQSYYYLDDKQEILEFLSQFPIYKTINIDWRKYVK